MQDSRDADAIELLLAERGTDLMRTAVLLAGGRHDGEEHAGISAGGTAIKLKLSSSYPQPVGWSGVLWADASSYLPVRLVSHGQGYSFLIDFHWLAPIAANLAKLYLPIPAGFRHV